MTKRSSDALQAVRHGRHLANRGTPALSDMHRSPLPQPSWKPRDYNAACRSRQLPFPRPCRSVAAAVDALRRKSATSTRPGRTATVHSDPYTARPAERPSESCRSIANCIRFPSNGFTHFLTLFSKFFSSFPHGTCSLSVSCQYLALDGVYHQFWAAFPSNPTHGKRIVNGPPCHERDCHPL